MEDLEKTLSEYLDDLLVQVKQDPRVKFKIEIYPNETEEPHFKVTYQNVTCRFLQGGKCPRSAAG